MLNYRNIGDILASVHVFCGCLLFALKQTLAQMSIYPLRIHMNKSDRICFVERVQMENHLPTHSSVAA